MGSIETVGRPRLTKGRFDPPATIAECVIYFGNIMALIEADADFLPIKTTKTDAALTAITFLKTQQEGFLKGTVTKAARDLAFKLMISKCKLVLAYVIKFATEHTDQAKDILQRNGICITTRKSATKNSVEIRHGKTSGTFKLLQKSQGRRVSYIWMNRIKGTTRWILADFSHKSTGMYSGGVVGDVYEFKAQYNKKRIKSAWSQIFEIICI